MTKERFFEIAVECGIDPDSGALISMWENRPESIRTIMNHESFDPIHEELLREFFEKIVRTFQQMEAHFKALNN